MDAWLAVALALVASFLVTGGIKPVARRLGAVAAPKADRWNRREVPLLGGVAIAVAVVAGTLAVGVRDAAIWQLLGGALTLLAVGLVDDLRPLKPQSKLVAQILVASVLAALGLQLRLTGYPALDVLVTVVWIVGITNAINLLDNMDGLAAGIAAIAVAFRVAFLLLDGNLPEATFAAVVLGATLGFLVHNFSPASIFMGDAGSLFLGTLVGGLSLVGGWPYSKSAIAVLLFPVLILLVPIFDTALVTLARTVAGRPISTGGRDHASHRLVALGLSEWEAVLLLYLVALASGGVAFLSYVYGLSYFAVLVVLLTLGLALFAVYLFRLQVYPEEEVKVKEGARFFTLIADFSYKRQVATVVIDLVLIVVAYYSAYLLRFETGVEREQPAFIASLPIVMTCQLAGLALFRTYQGVWRYTSLHDVVRLAQAVTLGSVAAVLTILFLYRFEGYSRAVFVLDWMALLVLIGGSRLFMRLLRERLRPGQAGPDRVLIFGAGDGGVMVLREILNNRALRRRAVGFLDDDKSKHRTSIHGVPVIGGFDALEDAIVRLDVIEVIISSTTITPERARAIGSVCHLRNVSVVRAALRLD